MSFDKPTRNLLAKMTAAARDRLAEDIAAQLQTSYGLYPDGSRLDVAQMPEDRHAAAELRALLDHFESAEPEGKQRKTNAYQRLVREIGFTLLNRLAALRLCEERGLVIECVRAGMNSAGFQLYDRLAGGALGNRYQTYRTFLACMFDELAADLGALFDRSTPQSAMFPSEPALNDVLALLNDPELTNRKIWQQDETIGWIYQYYNDPAERKKMRDESQAPRNSRELAVRNQFFTPRYVVEFLTDNTLGRAWYEMRQGQTKLTEQCHYLVQRRHPIFLTEGQDSPQPWRKDQAGQRFPQAPDQMWVQPDPDLRDIPLIFDYALTVYADAYAPEKLGEPLYKIAERIESYYSETGKWEGSFEELRCVLGFEQGRWQHYSSWPEGKDAETIQQLYRAICEQWDRGVDVVPFRAKKDPRHLSVLDPACGSGHFLLYAFDLLETIYGEAYDDYDLGPELQNAFPDRTDFTRQVPRLILENNLHGIDIDPRAAQIAALALWLRAQRAWQMQKLGAFERPQVGRTHIVVAEPMPGDESLLVEFINDLPKNQHPEVIGSLVRTVFEKMKLAGEAGSLLKVEEELKEAIEQARIEWAREPQPEQLSFLPIEPKTTQLGFDLSGFTDDAFWQRAEKLVFVAMESYANQAKNGKGLRRRLFVGDAAQGFAFVDLSHKRFDIVLMNPPFGASSKSSIRYIQENYPISKNDIYCAFVERTVGMLNKDGKLGVISSRTGFFLPSFENWRQEFLLTKTRLATMVDLGFNVLDNATVETAAYTISNSANVRFGDFIRLIESEDKVSALLNGITYLNSGSSYKNNFIAPHELFVRVPKKTLAYWVSDKLRQTFTKFLPLTPEHGQVSIGLATTNDPRFVRLAWEVPPESIGKENSWVWYAKGGKFARYYQDIYLLVRWANSGLEIQWSAIEKGDSPSRYIENESMYFKAGLTFPRTTIKGFNVRAMPAGCIFGNKGPAIFPKDNIYYFIGLLNSSVAEKLLLMMTTSRSWENSIVKALPIPSIRLNEKMVIDNVSKIIDNLRSKERKNETSRLFVSIEKKDFIKASEKDDKDLSEFIKLQKTVDALILQDYGLVESDLQILDSFSDKVTNSTSEDLISETDEDDNDSFFNNKYLEAASLISYCTGVLLGRWDVRYAIDESLAPALFDTFRQFPVCSPGMLINPQFLPATTGAIVSNTWLHAQNIGDFSSDINRNESDKHLSVIPDTLYPTPISWAGIMVDDPGMIRSHEPHEWDIQQCVEQVIQLIWPEDYESIIHESCQVFGVGELRDYFRKPSGFFADHLKHYSKSRRQAPIYWPLSTPSGSYTLWMYYQRLTSETLYTAVNRFISPKIEQMERYLSKLEEDLVIKVFGHSASELRDQVDSTRAFLAELNEFRTELLRVANLPYQPDLNDGVIINAAPLFKLFRLTKWSKDCQAAWEKLEDGEYDWSHMAYVLWPDRVREKCVKDKSLAIAHGLEELYQGEKKGKKKRIARTETQPELGDIGFE